MPFLDQQQWQKLGQAAVVAAVMGRVSAA